MTVLGDIATERAHAADIELARPLLVAGADEDSLYVRWFHGAEMVLTEYPSPGEYLAASVNESRFEGDWRVTTEDAGAPGALLVAAGDDVRLLAPPAYAPHPGAALVPRVGDRVRADPLTYSASDGFWHTWSAAWRRGDEPDRILRVYFAVRRGAEISVLQRLLAIAPAEDYWYAKSACGAHGHPRRDSLVLYLPLRASAEQFPDWLPRLVRATESLREADAPPLTTTLGPGAGIAVDPGNKLSFGQAVCRALCQATAEHPAALESPSAWIDAALTAVRPYLSLDVEVEL